MSDKHTHLIRDIMDQIDGCRADLAGVMELMKGEDERFAHAEVALEGLRASAFALSQAIEEEIQS